MFTGFVSDKWEGVTALGVARVIGIAVAMVNKRPRARVVVLDGTRTLPVLVDCFEVTTQESELVEQLFDVAVGVGNRASGLRPDRAMIQRADYFKTSSNQEGPRVRLLVEGAIAAAVRGHVGDVMARVGKDVAVLAGVSKSDLQTEASGVVLDDDYCEAACAALARLDP